MWVIVTVNIAGVSQFRKSFSKVRVGLGIRPVVNFHDCISNGVSSSALICHNRFGKSGI